MLIRMSSEVFQDNENTGENTLKGWKENTNQIDRIK